MAFKLNKVKANLSSYPHYLFLAPRKFGKTTWWSNLVTAAWGSVERGLLISCGSEEGYHALDNMQYEVAREWDADYDEETETRGLVQIIDDLVDNNKEYQIKGVCFDTLDTLVDVATKEVLRLSRKETGKPCKSLNEAFSGYGRGKARLINIINEQVDRLHAAGIAVFFLAHTKMKERTDVMTGEKFEQLTNNLNDDIYTSIADSAQMVMVGAFDRDISAGKITNERRVIYLRATSTVDAGSRFKNLPDTISLDVNDFLDAFNEGVKGSMTAGTTQSDIEKRRAEEEKANEAKAASAASRDKAARDEVSREEKENSRPDYLAQIQAKFPDAADAVKADCRSVLAKHGVKKFSDDALPIEALAEIVKMLG